MKFGFLGLGNMAKAIIKGMVLSRKYVPRNILGYTPRSEASREFLRELGGTVCATLAEAAQADVLVLAVKPQIMPLLMEDLRAEPLSDKLTISIAAGKDLEFLESSFGEGMAVVRVMSNINAKIGASTSAFAANAHCSEEQKIIVRDLFSTVGSITELPEFQFSAFSAIAGASPAFSYMYVDALARAAVKAGIPREKALEIAAGAVCGSARMLLESREHPYALIDQVCSPGGTTIEGICVLQALGFESAVHKAVEAAILKDRTLGGK